MERYSRIRFTHISRYIHEITLFLFLQQSTLQQKLIFIINVCQNTINALLGLFKCILFYARKTDKNNRIFSLQLSVFFVLPHIQTFKKFRPSCIFYREKLLQHTHIQCFSKAPRTGNKSYRILVFPPFTYQLCFIYIKSILHSYCLKILMPNPNSTCHNTHLLSQNSIYLDYTEIYYSSYLFRSIFVKYRFTLYFLLW